MGGFYLESPPNLEVDRGIKELQRNDPYKRERGSVSERAFTFNFSLDFSVFCPNFSLFLL